MSDPKSLKLTDYEPRSVFNLPEHHPHRAKFPVIDMHAHPEFAPTHKDIVEWAKRLEDNNVERVVIHTYAYGERFRIICDEFRSVSPIFEMWCGLDTNAIGTPEFAHRAIYDLEACLAYGAKGVGEIGDKGLGESYCLARDFNALTPHGGHLDSTDFDPVFDRIEELGLPVAVHMGDPIWMYEPMDNHNDGLMNSYAWKMDTENPDLLSLNEVCDTLLRRMDRNPRIRFIACHFMNISHDYPRLSAIMDKYPNLWLDNSARIVETCVTPRATKAFYEKYQDRIFFGTDNGPSQTMYDLNWRCLETEDEHFYDYDPNFFTTENTRYHWPLHGLGLSDEVLRKLYHDNAVKFMGY